MNRLRVEVNTANKTLKSTKSSNNLTSSESKEQLLKPSTVDAFTETTETVSPRDLKKEASREKKLQRAKEELMDVKNESAKCLKLKDEQIQRLKGELTHVKERADRVITSKDTQLQKAKDEIDALSRFNQR